MFFLVFTYTCLLAHTLAWALEEFEKIHSVLDVLAGTALAFIMYFIVFKWWFRNTEFPAPKIKDSKQHQVLYFLNKRK